MKLKRNVILSQKQLNEALPYWQKVLGLEEYDIIVIKKELGDKIMGRVTHPSRNKKHKIYINSLNEISTSLDYNVSINNLSTLIHELLHLKLFYFTEMKLNFWQNVKFEKLLNILSGTMAKLKMKRIRFKKSSDFKYVVKKWQKILNLPHWDINIFDGHEGYRYHSTGAFESIRIYHDNDIGKNEKDMLYSFIRIHIIDICGSYNQQDFELIRESLCDLSKILLDLKYSRI